MFPAAPANDFGGSIRIPAFWLRSRRPQASRGRVPRLNQSWLGAIVDVAVTRTVATPRVLDALSPDPLSWYNAARPAAAPSDMRSAPTPAGCGSG